MILLQLALSVIVEGLVAPVVVAVALLSPSPVVVETPSEPLRAAQSVDTPDATPSTYTAENHRSGRGGASGGDVTAYSPDVVALAWIVEGEAPTGVCSVDAQYAVAHIAGSGRNAVWYGWREPSPQALDVAATWRSVADPTFGATYLFSTTDLRQGRVQELTAKLKRTASFDCGSLGGIVAFR